MNKSFSSVLALVAIIATNTVAALSTRFTKAVGADGIDGKFIDLSTENLTILPNADGQLTLATKLRLDPMTMQLDLQDSTFFSQTSDSLGAQQAKIDLTGTLFKLMDDQKVGDLEPGQQKVKVQVDNDALLEKYQFAWDHAPQMWLSEYDDGYWPQDLQTFFDNMEAKNFYETDSDAGCDLHYDLLSNTSSLRMTTRVPLTGPYDDSQEFLHGQRPHNGEGVAIQTFIHPLEADLETEMDPLEMLLNPEESSVEISYIYFMAYDSVEWGVGMHVGDIEKTKVQFTKGQPTHVLPSFHNWHKNKEWDDVQKLGKHPVVYNARGTHATYFTAGEQLPIFDWTYPKEAWNFWHNLDVIFPWDYLKDDFKIKTDNNLNGINYLTEINKWGNEARGQKVPGEQQMVDGPHGYLNKFAERQIELEKLGYVCEGQDTTRCPWPFGIFSKNKPLCSEGYFFSYLGQKCQQQKPRSATVCDSANFTLAVADLLKGNQTCSIKESDCGRGYQAQCALTDSGDCAGQCITQPLAVDLEFDHVMCTKDGTWIDSKDYPTEDQSQVTFADTEQFSCEYEFY